MLTIWGIVYGIAWLAWLFCVIGGLGNSKVLGLCSFDGGFTPSEQYLLGIKITQMETQDNQVEPESL